MNQKGPEVDEFVFPIRVYYEDTDSGGVVYHANYLKFMERARTEWLRSLGFGQERLRRELGVLFTVRRLEVDYHKPAVFDDELIVVTRTAAPRHASLMFDQYVYRYANDALGSEPLCHAEVKVACVNAMTLRPQGLPEQITAELRNVS